MTSHCSGPCTNDVSCRCVTVFNLLKNGESIKFVNNCFCWPIDGPNHIERAWSPLGCHRGEDQDHIKLIPNCQQKTQSEHFLGQLRKCSYHLPHLKTIHFYLSDQWKNRLSSETWKQNPLVERLSIGFSSQSESQKPSSLRHSLLEEEFDRLVTRTLIERTGARQSVYFLRPSRKVELILRLVNRTT